MTWRRQPGRRRTAAEEAVHLEIVSCQGPACLILSCTAVLPIGEPTVSFVSGLLAAERVRRGT